MISALPNSVRLQNCFGMISRSIAQNAFRHQLARWPVTWNATVACDTSTIESAAMHGGWSLNTRYSSGPSQSAV